MENENNDLKQDSVSEEVNSIMNNSVSPAAQIISSMPNQDGTVPVYSKVKYAGFWIRFVAATVDSLVTSIPSGIVGFIFGMFIAVGGGKDNASLKAATSILGYVIGWAYYIFMTKNYQATLGKMAVGIKVVSNKSEDLTLGQVILRETVGKIVSALILGIGYIMAGFDERKQGLHDKLANTLVVFKNETSESKQTESEFSKHTPQKAITSLLAGIGCFFIALVIIFIIFIIFMVFFIVPNMNG